MQTKTCFIFVSLWLINFWSIGQSNLDFAILQDSSNSISIKMTDSVMIKFRKVNRGYFKMGNSNGYKNEKPVHLVAMSDFYMQQTELTQKQWKTITGNNPSYFNGCSDCPVEMVNYQMVTDYIDSLNNIINDSIFIIKLPTEAQWEYAARGGSENSREYYSGSYRVNEVAWYNANSNEKTHIVGQKKANVLGLYDMSGNVFEWTSDWMHKYSKHNREDPIGPEKGKTKIIRGGCWFGGHEACKVSTRVELAPEESNGCTGFRLIIKKK
ncbi:MAG: formylglycine-generating enzyme family protein [Bacteroidales bacterium]|nr:formylglycine-generating enzyme family protein [Bacteroidales bacterium]